MKFLHLATLSTTADQIQSVVEADTTSLAVRIEAYSCKKAGGDKKLYNALESQFKSEIQQQHQQHQQHHQHQQHQHQQQHQQQQQQPQIIRSMSWSDNQDQRQHHNSLSTSWGGNSQQNNNSWSNSQATNTNLLSASWGSNHPHQYQQNQPSSSWGNHHHHQNHQQLSISWGNQHQNNQHQQPNPLSLSWGSQPQNQQHAPLSSSWGNNNTPPGMSPFGPMIHKKCRETLIELICTLNAVFPDYDFSELRGDHFCREETNSVVSNINTKLSGYDKSFLALQKNLWQAIDEAIDLKECVVYSFHPDTKSSNPFEEDGTIWSFNYFFHNKKTLKRMLLFSCSAQLKDRDNNNKNDIEEVDEDDLYGRREEGGRRQWVNRHGDFEMDLMMEFEDF